MADQQYTTETRTDGNGNPYTVRIPVSDSNVITSDLLKPTTAVQIAPPTPDSTPYGGITGGVTDSLVADYKSLNDQLKAGQATQAKAGQDIIDTQKLIQGKAADTANANEAAGVNAESANLTKYAQQLADLNAQASALNREAQAIPLLTQENNKNTGATDAGVAPQTAGALRINALKALSIGQQADIAAAAATGSQLRLQAAKDKAQQIIDLKYKPLEDALALKQKQYDLNKDTLAVLDKNRTEALGVSLQKEATQLADQKAAVKANADKSSEYAKYAIDGGQSDLASQISSLDPGSKTFTQDLKVLQAKIKNPNMALDLALKQAQIDKLRKETQLLGEPTAAEKKAAVEAIANAKASLPAMQDKIATIDALKTSAGMGVRVGSNFLSRESPATDKGLLGLPGNIVAGIKDTVLGKGLVETTGAGQQFAGGVHQLTQGLTLQNLIDAKANGATFGALSDAELNLLASSATKLSDWEIKDNEGKPTGVWNIDQNSFNKELDNIKMLTQRAITKASGDSLSTDEKSILDQAYSNLPIDPAAYFK